ncbi:MAG: 16S rRNA (guanine(966)-N(2))-methyltransferase RsmD [Raoultibacter sp.]
MRIIAGEHRGRPIKTAKGDGTRPTTDRVREALMSVLASARGGWAGAVVLDAFAGSGALGLEALSRGAQRAVFYERDGAAARIISENITALGVGSSAKLVKTDVMKRPPISNAQSFDLVLLDPPYDVEPCAIVDLIQALDQAQVLAQDALVSYEYAKSNNSAVQEALESLQWKTISQKTYGDTSIIVVGKETYRS